MPWVEYSYFYSSTICKMETVIVTFKIYQAASFEITLGKLPTILYISAHTAELRQLFAFLYFNERIIRLDISIGGIWLRLKYVFREHVLSVPSLAEP